MASPVTPGLVLHWAAHAALVGSYAWFREAYAQSPSMARSPSYLISLGVVPEGTTQEVDLIGVTLVLAAQKWRRATNEYEFVETLLWYLQLAVGALLALTEARACVAFAALMLGASTARWAGRARLCPCGVGVCPPPPPSMASAGRVSRMATCHPSPPSRRPLHPPCPS